MVIRGGSHEIFYVIPAGLVGITCFRDFTAALDRSSINREVVDDFPVTVSRNITNIVIPFLFIFRSTISFAYLLNGMTVIIGTITMTHFSIENHPQVWTVQTILLGTCLPDILMLWGKFAVGKALFDLDSVISRPDAQISSGRFFRFPNMGFWFAHVVTLTAVYLIGSYFWK